MTQHLLERRVFLYVFQYNCQPQNMYTKSVIYPTMYNLTLSANTVPFVTLFTLVTQYPGLHHILCSVIVPSGLYSGIVQAELIVVQGEL